MRMITIVFVTVFAGVAGAREATPPAGAATVVASDGVNQPQLKAVGRLNVNTASRDELLKVPGITEAQADAILQARGTARITHLEALGLSPEALCHLKTEGESNFYRVRQFPLARLGDSDRTSASRR